MALMVFVNYAQVGDKIEILEGDYVFLDRKIAIRDLEEVIVEPMLITIKGSNGAEIPWPKVVDKITWLRDNMFVKLAEAGPNPNDPDLIKLVEDPNGKGEWISRNTRLDCLYKKKSTGELVMAIPKAVETQKTLPDENIAPVAKPVAKPSKKEAN